jgi:DNA invertase Pin-like site-specific DNA recombinase
VREQRPDLAALLDYARPGGAIVVVGIDRLGRNAAEVMTTIRELNQRNIVLRSLLEGIDTSNATGRIVAGVLASLAELELELGRERRAAARQARRARGESVGRPRSLDKPKAALAQRMHASGEPVSTIAATLGVSRATVYRVLAEQTAEGDSEHAAPLSPWTRDSRNSTRVFEFRSGLVDLVVCVGHHGGGGHRLTLAGERFVALLAKGVP